MTYVRALVVLVTLTLGGCATTPTGSNTVSIPPIIETNPWNKVTTTGYLYKPEGAGPFPAVVLLHGCDGLALNTSSQASWNLQREYARRYVERGFVALIMDSFTARGTSSICGNTTIRTKEVAWDAYAAHRLLGTLGYVDKDRIIVQGLSHGGGAVLAALEVSTWTKVPERFAAGIAFYPGCVLSPMGYNAPLTIFIGDRDDWTPSDRCEIIKHIPSEKPVELVVYPGARHSFDYPLGRREFHGHVLDHDPRATSDSWSRIEKVIEQVKAKRPTG